MQPRRRPPRERRILTILGDIAQATGPVAYPSWEEVLAHLPGEAEVEELRHAYRVPAEIMELALPLLERIAPDVSPPLAFRGGAVPPRVEHVQPDESSPPFARRSRWQRRRGFSR